MASIMVSAADVSLYAVAARVLGNPFQWWQIARLNGLSDPSLASLSMPTILRLPSSNPDALDGVPPAP